MLLLAGIVAIVLGVERARAGWRVGAWIGLVAVGVVAVVAGAPRGLILSKSLGLLVMPLGLLWTALFALVLGLVLKRRVREAAAVGAIWIVLTIGGNRPLADALLGWIEGEHALARPLEAGPLDAVIVLGGGTEDRPGGVQLGASGDRVMLGARLYRRGVTPLLLVSGAPIAGLSEHDAAAATRRIWRELGIPDEAIVTVEDARTTSEEARLYAALIRERGFERVGLVTSAWHMRRALALFEAEGVRAEPLPADVRSEPVVWRGFYSVIPEGRAAHDVHTACWELVGRAVGR